MPWTSRSAVMLKIAELLATKYRSVINAATMLGQSKNIYQAEIDSACETIDFLRYNVAFASRIYSSQPKSTTNHIDSMEYRALEGFVFAISPFNFTSIASNLNLSPCYDGKYHNMETGNNRYPIQLLLNAHIYGGRASSRSSKLPTWKWSCNW